MYTYIMCSISKDTHRHRYRYRYIYIFINEWMDINIHEQVSLSWLRSSNQEWDVIEFEPYLDVFLIGMSSNACLFTEVFFKVARQTFVWSWTNIQLFRVTISFNLIILRSLKSLLKFGKFLSNLSMLTVLFWILLFPNMTVYDCWLRFGIHIS